MVLYALSDMIRWYIVWCQNGGRGANSIVYCIRWSIVIAADEAGVNWIECFNIKRLFMANGRIKCNSVSYVFSLQW